MYFKPESYHGNYNFKHLEGIWLKNINLGLFHKTTEEKIHSVFLAILCNWIMASNLLDDYHLYYVANL